MTARVLFVRHGESVGNEVGQIQGWLDPPLTEKGLKQARRVAAALAGAGPFAAIYTSPLKRAATTAAEVGRVLRVTPEPDPDLRELDCGEATGLTWVEFARRFPEWAARIEASVGWQERDDLWPGGESISHFRERCRAAVARIVARHPADAVVVVAHGGSIGWALAHLLDRDSARWPDYRLPNASISEVLVGRGAARLVRLGDVSHLGGEGGS